MQKTEHVPRYRWASPHDWLGDRINAALSKAQGGRLSLEQDTAIADLAIIANTIVNGTLAVDSDAIQDAFQDDMEDAGFFRDLDRPVPVLYEIDERGEATGQVHYFCSEKCRDLFEAIFESGKVSKGELTVGSPEIEDGTVCDECGNVVA